MITNHVSVRTTLPTDIDSSTTSIVTHNGIFHADEVMAIAMILATSQEEVVVVRTRDTATIARADIVIDVGGKFDTITGRFDHHQPGGAGARNNGVPFASAGLVWNAYGHRAIDLLADSLNVGDDTLTDGQVVLVHNIVDQRLIQGIDALDNGYNVGDMTVPVMTVSGMISGLNPTWLETTDGANARFLQALELAWTVLRQVTISAIAEVVAEAWVTKAFEEAVGGILVLPKGGMPWARTLEELDPEHSKVKLVVYQDLTGSWRVQSPNVKQGDFALVCPLPEAWRGKRDDELAKLTGVLDAVFVHNNGFIGGAKSLAGVMEMARQAITLLQWSVV